MLLILLWCFIAIKTNRPINLGTICNITGIILIIGGLLIWSSEKLKSNYSENNILLEQLSSTRYDSAAAGSSELHKNRERKFPYKALTIIIILGIFYLSLGAFFSIESPTKKIIESELSNILEKIPTDFKQAPVTVHVDTVTLKYGLRKNNSFNLSTKIDKDEETPFGIRYRLLLNKRVKVNVSEVIYIKEPGSSGINNTIRLGSKALKHTEFTSFLYHPEFKPKDDKNLKIGEWIFNVIYDENILFKKSFYVGQDFVNANKKYPITIDVKITDGPIQSISGGFFKADDHLELKKSTVNQACVMAYSNEFPALEELDFNWELHSNTQGKIKEHKSSFTPTTSEYAIWICDDEFTKFDAGLYWLEINIAGNKFKKSFRLTK